MRAELPRVYEKAAREYLRRLPLCHFSEETSQATQREITLASLNLLHAQRPDVQVFNELLVQYPLPRRKRPGQVVPDNMVVVHPEPIKANWSYDLPLQPSSPFWVLDYISQWNKRKDYPDNRNKYEHDLKVPYYLLFLSGSREMTLHHHNGEKYVSVKPNAHGRCEIAELELEVGLHGGWMRYWFRGKLLLLPAELQAEIQKERREREAERRELENERSEGEKARDTRLAAGAELARLRAELEQLRRGAGG